MPTVPGTSPVHRVWESVISMSSCQAKNIDIPFTKNSKVDGSNMQTHDVSITRQPRKENQEAISDEVSLTEIFF